MRRVKAIVPILVSYEVEEEIEFDIEDDIYEKMLEEGCLAREIVEMYKDDRVIVKDGAPFDNDYCEILEENFWDMDIEAK